MQFIDIHTHNQIDDAESIVILNVSSDFDQVLDPGFYSAGLHPWYLDVNTAQEQFEQLERVCRKDNVLAIGECGLDKICKTDWNLQVDYFIRQVRLACRSNKTLIIHCVRSIEEVLKILKDENVSVPVVFHGFNKKLELARKILNQGYYLSFGKQLLMDDYAEVFKEIPLDKIFFETDDAPITIEAVYSKAAELLQLDMKSLTEQISKNFNLVFGTPISTPNE